MGEKESGPGDWWVLVVVWSIEGIQGKVHAFTMSSQVYTTGPTQSLALPHLGNEGQKSSGRSERAGFQGCLQLPALQTDRHHSTSASLQDSIKHTMAFLDGL